jgi:CubicO group peptidase (beta-lactamase class C family)
VSHLNFCDRFVRKKFLQISGNHVQKNIDTILMASITECTYSQAPKPGTNNFDSITNEFGREIQKDIQADSMGGSISVAIVHQNRIVWSRAYGYADKEQNVLADTSTIYRIGSISKSLTAFLMLLLVEKGLLKLDDPIERYLPEIIKLKGYNPRNKITFLELATHTSGLEPEPELPDAAVGPVRNWENKVLECLPATAIKTRPGKRFHYSNIGYAILGLALSRAAKQSFITLMEENIFVPLQMTNSYFEVPEEKISRLAEGIANGRAGEIDRETPNREQHNRGYKIPNGGVYSTSNDLSRFILSNMGFYSLLTPKDLGLMQSGKL